MSRITLGQDARANLERLLVRVAVVKSRRLTKALMRVLRKISRDVKRGEDSHEWSTRFVYIINGDTARATVGLAETGRRMRYAKRYREQIARADGPPSFGFVAPFERIRE